MALKSNTLDIGQVLEMHYEKEAWQDSLILSKLPNGQHEVALGEKPCTPSPTNTIFLWKYLEK